jgi:hypothetical protein
MISTGIARMIRKRTLSRLYSDFGAPMFRSTGYTASALPEKGGYSSVSSHR